MAATTVSAKADTMAGPDNNVRDMPARPLIGPLRRPRRRRLAIPAFFIALLAATVAVAVVARNRDDGGNASSTTNTIVVVPTSEVSTAQPPLVPTPSPLVAPATPPAGEQHLITAQEAETFYGLLRCSRGRELSNVVVPAGPEFQRGMAQSYDYYVGFWNDNDIEVGDVELVDTNRHEAS